ncbi:MAG: hypothetical protein ACI392_06540 [Paludibacteraceae bacterium]
MIKEIIIIICFIIITITIIVVIIWEIKYYILCKKEFEKIKIGDRYKQTISDFDDPFSEPLTTYYKVIDKKKVGLRRYVRLEYIPDDLTRENNFFRKTERIEYLIDLYEKC